MNNIKRIDEQIADHQKRIESLNQEKVTLAKMYELVESLSGDEKRAMYDILQEMDHEGDL